MITSAFLKKNILYKEH